jgi:hypothetical protein
VLVNTSAESIWPDSSEANSSDQTETLVLWRNYLSVLYREYAAKPGTAPKASQGHRELSPVALLRPGAGTPRARFPFVLDASHSTILRLHPAP